MFAQRNSLNDLVTISADIEHVNEKLSIIRYGQLYQSKLVGIGRKIIFKPTFDQSSEISAVSDIIIKEGQFYNDDLWCFGRTKNTNKGIEEIGRYCDYMFFKCLFQGELLGWA